QPVRNLDEKSIRRVQPEKIAHIPEESLVAFRPREPLSPLVPDNEERRTRLVLPAKDDVGLQLLEVEAARIARHRGIDVRRVPIVIVRRPRRRRQLTYVGKRSFRDEGLLVNL